MARSNTGGGVGTNQYAVKGTAKTAPASTAPPGATAALRADAAIIAAPERAAFDTMWGPPPTVDRLEVLGHRAEGGVFAIDANIDGRRVTIDNIDNWGIEIVTVDANGDSKSMWPDKWASEQLGADQHDAGVFEDWIRDYAGAYEADLYAPVHAGDMPAPTDEHAAAVTARYNTRFAPQKNGHSDG